VSADILAGVAIDVVLPPLWATGMTLIMTRRHVWSSLRLPMYWGTVSVGCLIGAVSERNWPAAIVSAAQILVVAAIWWNRRRKRKGSPLALGAKGRALRARLVQTLRERARPRPVLRPVPGGGPA
jgi:hypothetical protein